MVKRFLFVLMFAVFILISIEFIGAVAPCTAKYFTIDAGDYPGIGSECSLPDAEQYCNQYQIDNAGSWDECVAFDPMGQGGISFCKCKCMSYSGCDNCITYIGSSIDCAYVSLENCENSYYLTDGGFRPCVLELFRPLFEPVQDICSLSLDTPECSVSEPEVCYDGIDNDGDNYIDCDDSDCHNIICSFPGEEDIYSCVNIGLPPEPPAGGMAGGASEPPGEAEPWQCKLNHKPIAVVEFDKTGPFSDEDIVCTATISDEDEFSKQFAITFTISGGSGEGNPSAVIEHTRTDTQPFQVSVTIPGTYTKAGDNIECKVKPNDGISNGLEVKKIVLIKNRKPDIEAIRIFPDFLNDPAYANRWVKYTEVFERAVLCQVIATDLDLEHNPLTVHFTVSNTDPPGAEKKEKEKNCENGKTCSFAIDGSLIMPGKKVYCKAQASDGIEQSEQKITDITLPTHDLTILKKNLINVIKDVPLIVNKPLMARVWVKTESNLIDQTNVDTEVDLIFNGNIYHSEIKSFDMNYPPIADLKAHPDNFFRDGGRLNKGYKLLKFLKQADDSANFFKLEPFRNAGFLVVTAIVDPNNKIKENNENNNDGVWPFDARKQKDDEFLVLPVIVNIDGFAIDKDEYDMAVNQAGENYEFLLKVLPLDPTKTRLLEPVLHTRKPDNLARLDGRDLGYARDERKEISKELDKLGKSKGADLVIGMVLVEKIMLTKDEKAVYNGRKAGDGFYSPGSKKTVLLIYNALDETAVHYFGELNGLNKEYGAFPDFGKIAIEGWEINQHSWESIYPKITIWDILPAGGFTDVYDYPEHLPGVRKTKENNLGLRYFNIMGKDSLWINQETYWHFLNKLTEE